MRYLNTDERRRIIVISGLIGELDETITLWGSLKKSPTVLKNLRTAKTFALKALDELVNELSPEEYDKVLRMCKTAKFVMQYDFHGPVKTDPPKVFCTMEQDEALKVAQAIDDYYCHACDGDKPDCPYRKLMTAWDIDPINEVTEGCQYAYKCAERNTK